MNLRFAAITIPIVLAFSSCHVCEEMPVPRYVTKQITVTDTQIVTQVRSFDTIFYVATTDTVTIHDVETRVQVQVVRMPGDSIWVRPICPPDTVVVEKVRVETVEQTVMQAIEKNGWKKHLMIGGLAVAGLFAIGYAAKALRI